MTAAFLFLPSSEVALEVLLARTRRRWRQVDLAAIAGVRPHDVSRLECEKHVFMDHAQRILNALGIEPEGAK